MHDAADGACHCATWPARSIRVVVPYPAGGGADFVARVFCKALSDIIGQQFVVDNRGGANGNVGSEAAAKSTPDGYTLLVTASTNLTINPNLYRKMPFDVQRDLMPISILASSPTILVVHPTLPARSVKDLVAIAKARPGQLNFGSARAGSSAHSAAELFKMVAGVDMVHVPYKGTGPATADLLGGQIPLMFNNLPPSVALVEGGQAARACRYWREAFACHARRADNGGSWIFRRGPHVVERYAGPGRNPGGNSCAAQHGNQ